ncbi:hypothetical protein GCM10010468_63000 [Actinocorallia longicatena]|uniref:Uncharacterized protein n=1 Tax=Actinocorallia longicatena TaxID=111803 RepID=A0ABP6QIY2_9ACTN
MLELLQLQPQPVPRAHDGGAPHPSADPLRRFRDLPECQHPFNLAGTPARFVIDAVAHA